jgi:tRNA A-37 threonylcarbamoyl transferase component Bud32
MKRTVVVKDASGIRWQVSIPYASFFVDAPFPNPRRMLRVAGSEIIKKSPLRVIFGTTLDGDGQRIPAVVKIYRHAEIGDWIKANLLGSKARIEWKITTSAKERGLSTVVPIAYGEKRRWGVLRESYFITVRLFRCRTLEEVLFSEDGSLRKNFKERRPIIECLARLLREMHDKGLYHRDLHPGNFLVEEGNVRPPTVYLLDLHRASISRSLSLEKRIKSLAQFNMFATLSLSNGERLRFFNAYFGEDALWRNERRKLLKLIDVKTRKGRWRLWKHRQKRCMGTNKYFMRLRFSNMKGVAQRGVWKGEMAKFVLGARPGNGSPHACRSVDEGDGVHIVKDSRSKAAWEEKAVPGAAGPAVFIKYYKPKRGIRLLAYMLRRSPALRSWVAAYALRMRHINTVRAIAALEKRRAFHVLGGAYFLAEKVPDAVNLSDYLSAYPARTRRVVRSLALFLKKMHRRGVYHADMKATNILVCEGSAGETVFFITDLDHVFTRFRLTGRQVTRNLFQLNKSFPDFSLVSMRDRYRFLYDYCGSSSGKELRPYWRAVSRRTGRYLGREGKRDAGPERRMERRQ